MRRLDVKCARALLTAALLSCSVGLAHIRIYPSESILGAREKYTMRVPNERQVATIRIEGEFPANLQVYDFEFKPGWQVDIKKDAEGRIVGATWIGTIRPYEFVEFGMLGINPQRGDTLVWRFVQYYADGSKEEFTGPVGSFYPAPRVRLTSAPAAASPSGTGVATPMAADAPMPQSRPAAPAVSAAPVPAPTSAPNRDVGLDALQLRRERREQGEPEPPPPAPIVARIVRVIPREPLICAFELDNGQIWEQSESMQFSARPDEKITIRHGMFGSFFLKGDDGAVVRVHRVK